MEASDYKALAFELLTHTRELAKEHMAMSEVFRRRPSLIIEYQDFLEEVEQAVDTEFHSLNVAIESGGDFRPALQRLVTFLG